MDNPIEPINDQITFKASILDYLGKFEGGIMVKVAIVIDENYFEAIFYYTEERCLITVDEELEEKYFGGIIEQWSEYKNLMKYLINHVVPWKEMFNSIDDVKIPNQPEQPYTSNPDTQ